MKINTFIYIICTHRVAVYFMVFEKEFSIFLPIFLLHDPNVNRKTREREKEQAIENCLLLIFKTLTLSSSCNHYTFLSSTANFIFWILYFSFFTVSFTHSLRARVCVLCSIVYLPIHFKFHEINWKLFWTKHRTAKKYSKHLFTTHCCRCCERVKYW